MRLLLDTNVLIPALGPDLSDLPLPIREVMRESDHDFVVSVASLWEVAIKARLGKLTLPVPLAKVSRVLTDAEIEILPILMTHAFHEPRPSPGTKDPFDRLLLAQCAVEGLKLLTRDRTLAAHPLAWHPAFA